MDLRLEVCSSLFTPITVVVVVVVVFANASAYLFVSTHNHITFLIIEVQLPKFEDMQ